MIKNLIVITLCIMFLFVQIFFSYQYYASANKNANSPFQVGIHYVYEQDNLDQIYGQVTRLHDLGFKAIRITLECNPLEYNDLQNQKTDALFLATDNYGLAVALVIQNLDAIEKVDYYRWGSHLKYVQVMNEPELSSTWSVGSIFSDDEFALNLSRCIPQLSLIIFQPNFTPTLELDTYYEVMYRMSLAKNSILLA